MPAKPKRKPKAVEMTIQPYGCILFAGTDHKALSDMINKDVKKSMGKDAMEVLLPPPGEGGAYTAELGEGIIAVYFDEHIPEFICHESIHIGNLIMTHIGQEPTHKCGRDEHYAYLVQHIFKRLSEEIA